MNIYAKYLLLKKYQLQIFVVFVVKLLKIIIINNIDILCIYYFLIDSRSIFYLFVNFFILEISILLFLPKISANPIIPLSVEALIFISNFKFSLLASIGII